MTDLDRHIRMVRTIASARYGRRRSYYDDVVGYGMIGLTQALQHFNESRGVPFIPYMRRRVIWAMQDGLRDELDRLSRKTRSRMNSGEIEYSFVSLRALAGHSVNADAIEQLHRHEQIDAVRDAVEKLPKRERFAVCLYMDGVSRTKSAVIMGVTQGRISQMLTSAMARLKKKLIYHAPR